jgi:hypothetical protein
MLSARALVLSAAGCWLLAAGCWLLAAGCWLLVGGCWLLAAGCWLVPAGWCLLAGACWLVAGASRCREVYTTSTQRDNTPQGQRNNVVAELLTSGQVVWRLCTNAHNDHQKASHNAPCVRRWGEGWEAGRALHELVFKDAQISSNVLLGRGYFLSALATTGGCGCEWRMLSINSLGRICFMKLVHADTLPAAAECLKERRSFSFSNWRLEGSDSAAAFVRVRPRVR